MYWSTRKSTGRSEVAKKVELEVEQSLNYDIELRSSDPPTYHVRRSGHTIANSFEEIQVPGDVVGESSIVLKLPSEREGGRITSFTSCSCQKEKHSGLPCCHIFAVYSKTQRPFPEALVHQHWKGLPVLEVKSSFNNKRKQEHPQSSHISAKRVKHCVVDEATCVQLFRAQYRRSEEYAGTLYELLSKMAKHDSAQPVEVTFTGTPVKGSDTVQNPLLGTNKSTRKKEPNRVDAFGQAVQGTAARPSKRSKTCAQCKQKIPWEKKENATVHGASWYCTSCAQSHGLPMDS